jgi:nucleoside-diphosphate-sugar epimerase
MKILLTGATGFLGSHAAEELSRRGHSLTALVRETSDTGLLESLKVRLIRGSLHHCEALGATLREVDAVIHMAGAIKALSQSDFFAVNAAGTANLVQEILKNSQRPKIFLHVSTVAVHNPEEGEDFCLAPERCHPLSHYGQSKLAGEMALRPLRGKVQTITLRPPILYGPRDRELLPLFRSIKKGWAPLYGPGTNKLSICFAGDVAQCIADLVEHPTSGDEIFCLDDGKSHTWASLSQEIAGAVKSKPRYVRLPPWAFYGAAALSQGWAQLSRRPAVLTLNKMKEMRQDAWVCGFEKLHRSTKWKPKVLLKEGLSITFNYYEKECLI